MISKLTFAHMATSLGIKVLIFSAREKSGLLQAVEEKIGTICVPKTAAKNARQKWLASGSLVIGSIAIDEGASKALLKRKSLLAVGVKEVQTAFREGEAIQIVDHTGIAIAIARAKISSKELNKSSPLQNVILAHADDIVLM